MSRLQLNFNGGEIDPDEHERVDLDVYQSGLALAENVIPRPHGGLSRRGGLQAFGRLRNQLETVDLSTATVSAVNGGDTSALIAGQPFTTDTAIASAAPYVVAEFDFETEVTISGWDLSYYLDDVSATAGSDEGAGSGGPTASSRPPDPAPSRPSYSGGVFGEFDPE